MNKTTRKNSILDQLALRRGLAIAAFIAFVATASTTLLSSHAAEARATQVAPSVEYRAYKATSAQTRVAAKAGSVLTGKLNLNTATEEQLQLLPGIGPTKAERVVTYRKKRKFRRVRDLRRVKGFGYKSVKKLEPYLTVTGKSNLEIKSKN